MSESTGRRKNSGYTSYVPFVGWQYNLRMLLYLTEESVNKARHAQVLKKGLTRPDADLLFLVQTLGDSATPTELSRWLKRRPPTVSEHLNNMQADGLLKRRPVRGNSKIKRVVLTRKGQEALREASERDIIVSVMSSLSEREYRQLWRLLEKLKDAALSAAEAEKQRTATLPSDQPV